MEANEVIYYQALKSHDRRFDGVFFTCVVTTGIYCRPICPAIVPRRENCRFVRTPAEAELAGFRPCLRCRPELAPAVNYTHASALAEKFATYIDETLLMDESLSDVALKFGVSERQLRRLFTQRFGVEPKRYLISRRLLFAKQLLQDTSLPIIGVAFSAGFQSHGRLTINMRRVYGFTPERLRKESSLQSKVQTLTLRADYRPPFHWQALLAFLAGRATPSERIENGIYYRLVGRHEISVRHASAKNCLLADIPVELSHQSHALLEKVRHLFDLAANPLEIESSLARDPLLAPLIAQYPGLRIPGCWDEFELLLRVIIGQQISVAGATTIMRRLAERIGAAPEAIAKSTPQAIQALGMPLRRATTIWNIARLVKTSALDLRIRQPDEFYNNLIKVPGIGSWTAEYLKMRVLGWPDALPAGDLGLQKAVISDKRLTEKDLLTRAERWRPWRSYAALLLWKSLQNKGG